MGREIPRISVIIPCYNGEKFISDAIESVLCQSLEQFELIVIDDGSTDGSGSIIERFLSDNRIRLLRNRENLGIPVARNIGIDKSSGEFISFLDQDDLWAPAKLGKQMEVFMGDASGEVGLVFSSIDVVDVQGRKCKQPGRKVPPSINSSSRSAVLKALFLNNFIPIVSAMIRRECFDQMGMLDESIRNGGDDYEFCLRLSKRYRIHYIEESLAVRRMHGENYTDPERMIPDAIAFLGKFAEQVPELRGLKKKRTSGLLCELGSYFMREGNGHGARGAFKKSLQAYPLNLKAALALAIGATGVLGRGIFKTWYLLRGVAGKMPR